VEGRPFALTETDSVILRCRSEATASKDEPRALNSHPSRLAEEGSHLRMTAVRAASKGSVDRTTVSVILKREFDGASRR
jgi:hypothetical protein